MNSSIPVTKLESSDARNKAALATSSGSPMRHIGIVDTIRAITSADCRLATLWCALPYGGADGTQTPDLCVANPALIPPEDSTDPPAVDQVTGRYPNISSFKGFGGWEI